MQKEETIGYHSKRAMQEMDQGLIASNPCASRAHLRLSSLHMQKALALADRKTRPRPPFVM